MGGAGSGRRWRFDGHDTVDTCQQLDVRCMERKGWLAPGRSTTITWKRSGEPAGYISVRAEIGFVLLNYRVRSGGSAWEELAYPVPLVATPCHLGGERRWFLCPMLGCGRRVAILYGGRIFACRRCHRLAYPSQREGRIDRTYRKLNSIRKRLSWPGGLMDGTAWGKPKGMHWTTFERLYQEHAELEAVLNASLISQHARMVGDGAIWR